MEKVLFTLTKGRKKQLSELEVTMFEEFSEMLWLMRKQLLHPKTKLSDEEMKTIIHNVSRMMNDYLKESFKSLFK